MNKSRSFLDTTDFYFVICGEKKTQNGEDSYYMDVDDDGAMCFVFDGCGGSGAKIYPEFGRKTGAFVASRAAAEAAWEWKHSLKRGEAEGTFSESLSSSINQKLAVYHGLVRSGSMLRSSITREFPTTLAGIYLRPYKDGNADLADFFWCGDSRCYILTEMGLQQISLDDLPVKDAFRNLKEDAAMQNVISSSGKYVLHNRKLRITLPCVFFSATDGCFGYLKSPMAFERLLLKTLMKSKSIAGWKELLFQSWRKIAGDDFTISMLGAGFGSFQALRTFFSQRLQYLDRNFPAREDMTEDELQQQWDAYRVSYEELCTEEKQ